MKSNPTVTKETTRPVKTYTYLWKTSGWLLEKGQADQTGSFYPFMASLVFTAFTLEAYLNHIGRRVFSKCWDDHERLEPLKKLKLIAERLQVVADYGHRPWQVMNGLFVFRNYIAHGKLEDLETSQSVPLDQYSDDPFGEVERAKWEKYCTGKNAQRDREDVEKIIYALHEAGPSVNKCPFTPDFQFGTATLRD